MGHDLSEKEGDRVPATSNSSDRASTSDTSRQRFENEKHTPETPAKQLDLQKLDSNIVEVPKKDLDPFKHLPPHEAAILRRQVDTPDSPSNYWSLYRYATFNDKIIIAVSVVCAIAGGAALPLMTVVFGALAGQFQGLFLNTIDKGDFDDILAKNVLYFVYLAIGEFATGKTNPNPVPEIRSKVELTVFSLHLDGWFHLHGRAHQCQDQRALP